MKMRNFNHLVAIMCVIANILALIAVLTGMHTLFGTVAVSISLAISVGMYLRVLIGTAAMQVAEKQEKLVTFAIAQKKDPEVVRKFAELVETLNLDFKGAKIVDLCKAVDDNGNCEGFWLLLVGTQSQYEAIKKELSSTSTVLDYWPIDPKKWCSNLLEALENDEDFKEYDVIHEQILFGPEDFDDDDDIIPELKG